MINEQPTNPTGALSPATSFDSWALAYEVALKYMTDVATSKRQSVFGVLPIQRGDRWLLKPIQVPRSAFIKQLERLRETGADINFATTVQLYQAAFETAHARSLGSR